MANEENSIKVENEKPKQGRPERERGRRGQKKEKQKLQTKIVIRHLPPTMSEEEFLQQIDPLPEHDFYYFAAADWSLGYDATCRAYITLKEHNDVYLFRDRFDGYVFVDSKGAEYPAIVEFAPFQGLLKNKSRRSDNKVDSIEQESHYQQFLAKLEEDREAAAKGGESKLEFSLIRKKDEKITSTPLLQYLANKKEKRREDAKKRTEEKRRQREEEKEKRRISQQQVTKIISSHDGGGRSRRDSGSKSGAGADGKENVSYDNGEKQQQEEHKNSRCKRRADRDYQRREEHEQRKRERDHKVKGVKSEEKRGDKKAETSKNAELKSQQSLEKPSDDSNQRKDYTKKRSRNRRGNSYECNDNDKGKKNEIPSAASNLDDLKPELMKTSVSGNGDEVNVTVVDFIRSVVTAKEFVPSKKQQLPADAITTVTEKESSTDEIATKEQTKKSRSLKVKDDEVKKENTRSEKSNTRDESRQTRRERTAEERRIRNKDRPSIAIYQPKPRMRVSEERDTNTGGVSGGGASKDARSNPASDCESSKKDEQRFKKVSRYSERRLERKSANANKDKQQKASESDGAGAGGSSNDNHDNDKREENRHELQKSVSCVEATSNIENETEIEIETNNQNDSDTEN